MTARNKPTLVALHGHGDDAVATHGWASELLPGGWALEVPAAPGRSWFETVPTGVERASFDRSRQQLADTVAGLVAEGAGPVVLAGFSQGAAMALSLGDLPGLSGVVALCPFLPEHEDLDLAAGPGALLLPASHDDVVPAFLGEDAAAAMAAAGREVTVATVPASHEVSGTALQRARAWLEQRWPGRPRFSVGLPVDRVSTGTELVSGDAIADLARAWEEAGFDAAFVTDHPAPDDRWLAAGGHHALEPTVALAVAASATRRLRLHTHVMVLAYRNPFLAAKAIATLDVVSAGRVILGVAAGYLRPEFEALGVDFDSRGSLLDESLATMRRVWSEESVSGEGGMGGRGAWSARSVTALPRPPQHPGPPVWIGGNSMRAIRRAVELGDGWSPFPTPGALARAARTAAITSHADLARRLERLDEVCEEQGRAQRPTVCFSPLSSGDYLADPLEGLGAMVEEVGQLSEMGVDWVVLNVPGLGRSEVIERAGALGQALGCTAGTP